MLEVEPPVSIAAWPPEVAEMTLTLRNLRRQYLRNENRSLSYELIGCLSIAVIIGIV